MFSDRFDELCQMKGVKPGRACMEMGLSRTLAAKWKASGTKKPSADVLEKMAVYFKMSIEEILGGSKNKTPTLSDKDERDIARDLESIMADLDKGGSLMFDGNPMTDEARESIKAAMKLGLEAAKNKNKERFTPKKFRKE